jgi:uncharacterized protein (DUF2252 family)
MATIQRHTSALAPALAVALSSCGEPQITPPTPQPLVPAPAAHPLDIAAGDAPRDAALLARVRASALGYFRLINVAFANQVCERFRGDLGAMRAVNLHGDAHIEQYAITDSGRGLTDFDDAASGPAVLDLARFATSLVLACQARGWDDAAEATIARFLDGYRAALADPGLSAEEPHAVGRLRAQLSFDPRRYFEWLATVSEPVPDELRQAVAAALSPYVEATVATQPDLGRDYFAVQDVGRSRMGIGSAQKSKFIVRVAGPSSSPDDDDVLELKELSDVSSIACLARNSAFDPMRLLVAQARIAYEPYRFGGYVELSRKYYWVHAWAKVYQELSPEHLESADELADIAFDVGVQLGLGHPKYIAAPFDRELRESGLAFLEAQGPALTALARSSADDVTAAWTRFKAATSK